MGKSKWTVLLAAVMAAPVALAHPGHGGGLAAGFSHPLGGIDHILAMVAVGLLAVQIGGRVVWALPLTFVSLMLVGGLLSLGHAPVPLVEQGIMASVLVLGLCIAIASRMPMPLATALVGVFAIFHGYAHVTEMQSGSSPMAYGIGFVAATMVLHGVGLGIGLMMHRHTPRPVGRIAGVGIAACGLLLFAGAL